MKGVYYNEFEPYAAEWLRNLIKAGLIPAGDVDERDIRDVTPEELMGYAQCHFFAGIGGWAYALRLAGWGDDRPVWTGSCPCPPFSSAGRKKACPECGGTNPVPHVGRTGYFVCCLCGHEWLADERHLWPEMWRLIRDGRPSVFFGEQVASADGRVWLASVRASLEILGYAVGASDLCAAGVGAPHIRQRLWFVADAERRTTERHRHKVGGTQEGMQGEAWEQRIWDDRGDGGPTDLLGHASPPGLPLCEPETLPGERRRDEGGAVEQSGGASGELADTHECPDLGGQPRPEFGAVPAEDGGVRANIHVRVRSDNAVEPGGALPGVRDDSGGNGNFWHPCEWLPCRDGKYRPTKPGIQPLAHGVSGRVGRLRAYGNAIVPEVAAVWIRESSI